MSSSSEFLEIYIDRITRAIQNGQKPIMRSSATNEIVLSFDKKYRPFIPTNVGLNKLEDRLFIKENKFTRNLGLDLQEKRVNLNDIAGGRVFIKSNSSYIKQKDGSVIHFSSLGFKT